MTVTASWPITARHFGRDADQSEAGVLGCGMRMLGKTSGPFLSCGNPGKLFTADRHWWKSGEVKICPPGRGDYLWFVPQGGDDPSLARGASWVCLGPGLGGGCLAPSHTFAGSEPVITASELVWAWGQQPLRAPVITLSPIHPHWPATAWITSQLRLQHQPRLRTRISGQGSPSTTRVLVTSIQSPKLGREQSLQTCWARLFRDQNFVHSTNWNLDLEGISDI